MDLDHLDGRIITLFTEQPRISVLEASRILSVARATVQARLDRMTKSGVISGWGPKIDPSSLGYPVMAFCSLTIEQDSGHDAVADKLASIPEVQEVHTVSGGSDLVVKVVARSNPDLQRVIDSIVATRMVVRSSSTIVLNTHFQDRSLPLVQSSESP
jgi:DNA-binding Lrp family transcriptional regulator